MKLIDNARVKLIDYTGKSSCHSMYAARKLIYTKKTRLEQCESTWNDIFSLTDEQVIRELKYIEESVRSSWEFVDFTFQISDVSRGFTHQLVRTRQASYAQQSQRVVDMSGFDYTVGPVIRYNPKMLEVYESAMEDIAVAYSKLISLGAPAQDARGVLPTAVSTSIIMSVNLRTLAELTGKRDNPRAEGEYNKVFHQMVACAIMELPWIVPFLYPDRSCTPELDKILISLRGDRSPVENNDLNNAMKELDKVKGTWG